MVPTFEVLRRYVAAFPSLEKWPMNSPDWPRGSSSHDLRMSGSMGGLSQQIQAPCFHTLERFASQLNATISLAIVDISLSYTPCSSPHHVNINPVLPLSVLLFPDPRFQPKRIQLFTSSNNTHITTLCHHIITSLISNTTTGIHHVASYTSSDQIHFASRTTNLLNTKRRSSLRASLLPIPKCTSTPLQAGSKGRMHKTPIK
jgi:hypothetical protein